MAAVSLQQTMGMPPLQAMVQSFASRQLQDISFVRHGEQLQAQLRTLIPSISSVATLARRVRPATDLISFPDFWDQMLGLLYPSTKQAPNENMRPALQVLFRKACTGLVRPRSTSQFGS